MNVLFKLMMTFLVIAAVMIRIDFSNNEDGTWLRTPQWYRFIGGCMVIGFVVTFFMWLWQL